MSVVFVDINDLEYELKSLKSQVKTCDQELQYITEQFKVAQKKALGSIRTKINQKKQALTRCQEEKEKITSWVEEYGTLPIEGGPIEMDS